MSSRPVATSGPVLIVGSGLLGAPLGLALKGAGVSVYLHDASPAALRLAQGIGAGVPLSDITNPSPSLTVITAPPDVADLCTLDALCTFPSVVITDVISVKSAITDGVFTTFVTAQQERFAARYMSDHPTTGREGLGVGVADANFFYDHPWVMVTHEHSAPQAALAVCMLAGDAGAVPVGMDARTHNDSVIPVSHVSQLVFSSPAARLTEARSESLDLAGQGVRDTTWIAASDPRLWTAILMGNAGPVVEALESLCADPDDLFAHLKVAAQRGLLRGGNVGVVNKMMEAGDRRVSRLLGKHDGTPRHYALLKVLTPDEPDEPGRLFTEPSGVGTSIEDLPLEHSAGQAVSLAGIVVDLGCLNKTEKESERRGWRLTTGAV